MKLFLILISFPVVAADELVRPLMYERVLEKSLKKEDEPKQCLHSGTQKKIVFLKRSTVTRDSFMATISCRRQCKGQEINNFVLRRKFEPRELSLYLGDGSSGDKIIWRSLGVTLAIWAKEHCFQEALRVCQNEVDTFSMEKISSGNWSLEEELNCSSKSTIYSPFDSKFKIESKEGTNFFMPTRSSQFSFPETYQNKIAEFFIDQEEASLKKLLNNKSCRKKIKVHSCFGDCIWETKSGKFAETLSTKEYFGTNDFTLCGDQLEQKLKKRNYSQSVRAFKCDKFVWEFMRKTETQGSSCAALRVETNCHQF